MLFKTKSHQEIAERNKTIYELRVKLEIRTWILRASLTLNLGLITGLIVKAL